MPKFPKSTTTKAITYATASVGFEDVVLPESLQEVVADFAAGKIGLGQLEENYLLEVDLVQKEQELNSEQVSDLKSFLYLVKSYLQPEEGDFDLEHLLRINKSTFPHLDTAGKFRPEITRKDVVWRKHRWYKSFGTVMVSYSHMTAQDRQDLKDLLSTVKADALKCQTKSDMVNLLMRIYPVYDFIHPFRDGNSRSFREYMRSLADFAGFRLDWSKVTRDQVCTARDAVVNELAYAYYNKLFTAQAGSDETVDPETAKQAAEINTLTQVILREAEADRSHPDYIGLRKVFSTCISARKRQPTQ